ncbi:MAG: four helix bundle protein [Bacteroidia bacterium]
MRDFRNLEIWKKGISMVKDIYTVTKLLPDTEKFGLISQMQRCAVSIPSNIAEGCSRNSEREFKRFLEIAIGSAFELETQLLICVELNYFSQQQVERIQKNLTTIQKQVNSLITKIAFSL